MIGLKILFWVIAVLLVMIGSVAFMTSTIKDRTAGDRVVDVFVGAVMFLILYLTIALFGGYIL